MRYPLLAAEDALRDFAPDEVVVVTRPDEEATWLEEGSSEVLLSCARRPSAEVLPQRGTDLPGERERLESVASGDRSAHRVVTPCLRVSGPLPCRFLAQPSCVASLVSRLCPMGG